MGQKTAAPHGLTDAAQRAGVAISFPHPGAIRVYSKALFASLDGPEFPQFLRRAFAAREVRGLAMGHAPLATVDLLFDAARYSPRQVLTQLADVLQGGGTEAESQNTA